MIRGVQYVQVTEEDADEPIELPSEEDGTLLLTTLAAQWPGACGLKYRPEEGTMRWRGLRLADGKLHPPDPDGHWGNIKYVVNLVPKENKRKGDDGLENPNAKTKRVENKKCSDLIVLGLPWRTTKEDVKKYFGKFGEVLMVQIKTDIHTNKSKGFGFIRFAEYDSQLACLKERHHIDGRRCEVRIPNSQVGSSDHGPRKVFVGRTTENMTADDLRQFFTRFGDVTDVFIPKPFRAFAFVTFADAEVAQDLLGNDYLIDGVSVHVCTASPKSDKNQEKRKSDGSSAGSYRDDRSDGYTQKGSGVGSGGGGGGGGNWNNHMNNPGRGDGGNMGGGNMNMGMGGMGMGQFALNPAMVAAALSQTPWGLFGLTNQGSNSGGGDCNNQNYGSGSGGGGGGGSSSGGGGSSGYNSNSGNSSSGNMNSSNNGFFGGWASGNSGSERSDSGNGSGWGNIRDSVIGPK